MLLLNAEKWFTINLIKLINHFFLLQNFVSTKKLSNKFPSIDKNFLWCIPPNT